MMKKSNKIILGLAGCAMAAAGAGVAFGNGQSAQPVIATGSTVYSATIRLYVDLGWDNINYVSASDTSGSAYANAVLSASASSAIAPFVSSGNGKYVSDISQATAVNGSTSAALRLFFQQGSCYYHPTTAPEDPKDWDTTDNYLTLLSANPGDIVGISSITYSHQYDDQSQKWFTYAPRKIGQFLHFDANGGSLPSGQAETIEFDGDAGTATTALPAACVRTDGYVFDHWTYNGIVAAAGATITMASGVYAVYANYVVTADSFAAWLMSSDRDSQTCSEKYSAAHTLWTAMDDTEKAKFTASAYADAYPRWMAWKAANLQQGANVIENVKEDSSSTLAIGALAGAAVLFVSAYFFTRKKKHLA